MAKTNYSPTFPMYPGDAATITPNDSVNFATPSIVWVGTAGNIKVTTAQGTDIVFASVPGGVVLPVQVLRVWATGTAATNLVRIF